MTSPGLVEMLTGAESLQRDGVGDDAHTALEVLTALTGNSPAGLAVFDRRLCCRHANPAYTELAGRTIDELLGASLADTLPATTPHRLVRELSAPLITGEPCEIDLDDVGFTRAGSGRYWRVTSYPLRLPSGRIIGLGLHVDDTTEAAAQRRSLQHLATHDPLTGLPNRRMLLERLEPTLTGWPFTDATQPAVLLFDLDRFKQINDTHGHAAGDELLGVVARRLGHALREDDLLARWGGDEFVLLCPQVPGAEPVQAIAERLRAVISDPIQLVGCGRTVTITASVGIALAGPADTAESVLAAADAELYANKERRSDAVAVPAGPDALAEQNAQLREALDSRTAIGQATGLLMGLHGCSAKQAFALLVRLSQTRHRKLRVIAEQYLVAAGAGSPACGGNPDRPGECDVRCWDADDAGFTVNCLYALAQS